MGLLDRFRSDPTAKLLRKEPVLALPANLASARVAAYAREWDPGAVTAGSGVLLLDDAVELHGPVSYDEALWRRAKLPAECAVAYAARMRPAVDDNDSADVHHDLIAGLCDRAGGRWRQRVRHPWWDEETDPPDPYVYAPRLLAPDELLGLVAPIVSGAKVFDDSEPASSAIDGEMVMIEVDALEPTTFPQVKLQPWFASAERLTQYAVIPDVTAQAMEQAVRAAGAIAEATGGLLLTEYGFPWRSR